MSWAAPIAALPRARSRSVFTPPSCGRSSNRSRKGQRLRRKNFGEDRGQMTDDGGQMFFRRPTSVFWRLSSALEQRRRLYFYSGSHARGDGDAVDESALGAGGLCLLNRIGKSLDIGY